MLLPAKKAWRYEEKLGSSCQRLQELTPVHVIFERLAAIDEDHRHLFVELLAQLGVAIDIHGAPLEIGFVLELRKRLLDDVAEMTSLARIHDYFMHNILNETRVSDYRVRPSTLFSTPFYFADFRAAAQRFF